MTATLRVATTNLDRGLLPHSAALLSELREKEIDMAVVAEPNVNSASRQALHSFARTHGYTAYHATGGSDSRVCLLARTTFEQGHLEGVRLAFPERVVLGRIHREGMEPLLVAGVYAHQQQQPERERLVVDTALALEATGMQWIMMGDFNDEADEGGAAYLQANGVARALDEDFAVTTLPTRHPGQRIIDYGLSSRGIWATGRQQHVGIRDHDLIVYDIPVGFEDRHPHGMPTRKKLQTHKDVSQEAMDKIFDAEAFKCRLQDNDVDVDMAWKVLSETGERLLGAPGGGLPRHEAWTPSHSRARHHQQGCGSTVAQVRLQKLSRQLRELQRRPQDAPLRRATSRTLEALATRWPELRAHGDMAAEAADFVTQLAQDEAEAARRDALLSWRAGISEDVRAQRRWIRRETAAQQHNEQANKTLQPASPLHPKDKVEALATEWTGLWNKDHEADHVAAPDDFADFERYLVGHRAHLEDRLGPLPEGRHVGREIPDITAAALRRQARKCRRKSAGADGWRADQALCLPDGWWRSLALLWRTCLDVGRLPQRWTEARTVLIPKRQGGWRPITVASLWWRLGASILAQALGYSANGWAPPAVQGCLPGRGAHWIHARLRHGLRQAQQSYALVVNDVSKAFDHVHVAQPLAILSCFGVSTAFLWIIHVFYTQAKRVFQLGECVTAAWHRGRHGVMQGCPLSPVLLAAIMCVWSAYFREHTDLDHGIYVDDRCWWAVGRGAVQRVMQAGAVSETADLAFGFTLNTKTCGMASTEYGRRLMRSLCLPGQEMPVGTSVKLLGLIYHADLDRVPLFEPDRVAKFCERAKRISYAARDRAQRRGHMAGMCFPLITWASAFTKLGSGHGSKLRTAARKAVAGWTPAGRSRFLMQELLLKPEDSLDYMMARTAVSMLHKWVHVMPQPWHELLDEDFLASAPPTWAPALAEILDNWQWQWRQDTATLTREAHGQERVYHALYESPAVLRSWCADARRQQLFQGEGRIWTPGDQRRRGMLAAPAIGLRLPPPPPAQLPALDGHRAFLKDAEAFDGDRLQVALGAGLNAWGPWRRHVGEAQVVPCPCGHFDPSFAHFMWNCPWAARWRPAIRALPGVDGARRRGTQLPPRPLCAECLPGRRPPGAPQPGEQRPGARGHGRRREGGPCRLGSGLAHARQRRVAHRGRPHARRGPHPLRGGAGRHPAAHDGAGGDGSRLAQADRVGLRLHLRCADLGWGPPRRPARIPPGLRAGHDRAAHGLLRGGAGLDPQPRQAAPRRLGGTRGLRHRDLPGRQRQGGRCGHAAAQAAAEAAARGPRPGACGRGLEQGGSASGGHDPGAVEAAPAAPRPPEAGPAAG